MGLIIGKEFGEKCKGREEAIGNRDQVAGMGLGLPMGCFGGLRVLRVWKGIGMGRLRVGDERGPT